MNFSPATIGSSPASTQAVAAMAARKWISDLTAATALADAARRVLTVRLEAVRDFLVPAVQQPYKDPEHVHRLRVATRRATAALHIFTPCLPHKVYTAARKGLRRVRRGAGAARDWDVFLDHLAEWGRRPPPRRRPGLDFLTGYAVAQRTAAQARLQEAGQDVPFSLDRVLAETVAAVHKPHLAGLRTLADLARPLLADALQELRRATAADLDDYGHLHQVRIRGKRLRYAMEVFADCFGPSFREQIYPAVEAMQEILGNANDSHVATGRLEALRTTFQQMRPAEWKRFQPGIEAFLRYHQERLVQERQHFRQWWDDWQQLGAEAAFADATH